MGGLPQRTDSESETWLIVPGGLVARLQNASARPRLNQWGERDVRRQRSAQPPKRATSRRTEMLLRDVSWETSRNVRAHLLAGSISICIVMGCGSGKSDDNDSNRGVPAQQAPSPEPVKEGRGSPSNGGTLSNGGNASAGTASGGERYRGRKPGGTLTPGLQNPSEACSASSSAGVPQ